MPTEDEIIRAVTALTSDLGLAQAAPETTAQVVALLTRTIQAAGDFPESWAQLQQWVLKHAAGTEATLVLPALEDRQRRRAFFPELPGG